MQAATKEWQHLGKSKDTRENPTSISDRELRLMQDSLLVLTPFSAPASAFALPISRAEIL